MRLLCGVATGLFYGEKKDGGSFWLFGSAVGAAPFRASAPDAAQRGCLWAAMAWVVQMAVGWDCL